MSYTIPVTDSLISILEDSCKYGNHLIEELLDIIHSEGLTEIHSNELDGDLLEALEDILEEWW